MNKFLKRAMVTAAAFCVAAPSTGHSFLYKRGEAKEQKPATYPFYGKLTPNMAVRDLHLIAFNKQVSASARSTVSTDHSFGAGMGLNPEFGWRDCFRIKGRTFVSGTRTLSGGAALEGAVKTLFFDADASMTLFAPVNNRVSILMSGGWEYKWTHMTERVQGTEASFTSGILRLNGPFAGFGVNFHPNSAWTVESGVNYHIPNGTGCLRTQDGNGNSSPQAWLARAHYRGGRFGLGGYIEANWQSSTHWSMSLSVEGMSLSSKGQHIGAAVATEAESQTESMSLNYVNYGFGLNYTF